MTDSAIIIFVKNPVAGKVKTRIAASVGDEKALEIYHKLVAHTCEIIAQVPVDRFVFYSDFIDDDDLWDRTLFQKRLQEGTDLGSRMKAAFSDILNDYNKVVIVGSDCIELHESHILLAIDKLLYHDLVFGPAEDGGYYLMGMKNLHPFLFENIRWSEPEVFATSMDRAKENELAIGLLPVLSDVDFIEDWEKHMK